MGDNDSGVRGTENAEKRQEKEAENPGGKRDTQVEMERNHRTFSEEDFIELLPKKGLVAKAKNWGIEKAQQMSKSMLVRAISAKIAKGGPQPAEPETEKGGKTLVDQAYDSGDSEDPTWSEMEELMDKRSNSRSPTKRRRDEQVDEQRTSAKAETDNARIAAYREAERDRKVSRKRKRSKKRSLKTKKRRRRYSASEWSSESESSSSESGESSLGFLSSSDSETEKYERKLHRKLGQGARESIIQRGKGVTRALGALSRGIKTKSRKELEKAKNILKRQAFDLCVANEDSWDVVSEMDRKSTKWAPKEWRKEAEEARKRLEKKGKKRGKFEGKGGRPNSVVRSPFVRAPRPERGSWGNATTAGNQDTWLGTAQKKTDVKKEPETARSELQEGKSLTPEEFELLYERAGKTEWDERLLKEKGILGSLKRHIRQWYEAGAPRSVLDVLQFGYSIPFLSVPPPMDAPNNQSAKRHPSFVGQEIRKLKTGGFIREVREKPYTVSPLTVADNSSKLRLVLDLSRVNKHVKLDKFKVEEFKVLEPFLRKGGYMFKFDLKSGYHHVHMNWAHQKYLGFCWEGKYYVFTVLPFGLASAPYIFTKIMRVWVKKWRTQGIPIVIYLDDGIVVMPSFLECMGASGIVQADLLQGGWVTALEKCAWKPVQILEWIGLCIDLMRFVVYIKEKRVQKALRDVGKIIRAKGWTTARGLARVTGQIISMGLVIGSLSQLWTRHSYWDILTRYSWDKPLKISQQTLAELCFWQRLLRKPNLKRLGVTKRVINMEVYSDASCSGGGASVEVEGIEQTCVVQWEEETKGKSSAFRELKALHIALKSFTHFLHSKAVQWNTDNKALESIIPKGSMKQDLHELAKKVFYVCAKNRIELQVNWIPRGMNERADFLSRIIDFDDWEVREHVFERLQRHFNIEFTADCFANHKNRKCQKFYSRWWVPNTTAVNAFAQEWRRDVNWVVPPITLLVKAVDYISDSKCEAVLVAPAWKSQMFWSKLFPKGGEAPKTLKEVLFIEGDDVFAPGTQKQSVFSKEFKGKVLVAHFTPSVDLSLKL